MSFKKWFPLFLVLFSCNLPQEKKMHEKLTMGVSADYPPFEFVRNGEILGFDIDLARKVCSELGIHLEIKDMDFNGLIPALQMGRVDIVMSGISVTQERKNKLNFSSIYYQTKVSLLILKDKASEFQQEKDLASKLIGAQLGSTLEKFAKSLKEKIPSLEIRALSKNQVLIEELKVGRLDGVLAEQAQAKEFMQASSTLLEIPPTFWSQDARVENSGYAMAFPKEGIDSNTLELQSKIDQKLNELKKNGFIRELEKKWMLAQ